MRDVHAHHVQVEYCEDRRPEQQLPRATGQHSRFKPTLTQDSIWDSMKLAC